MQAAANMATRDSDTSLWLHNKLGTSNDSWTGSSICSQLNSEVLRNIKDCFPDLQNQVKLKLLLSFFHIPRRNVEEWRAELEEIIEVASLDSDLWVSMLSETLKTFPSTGSLNTDLAELDEHRSIFGELINDLRKLLRRKNDPNMLPLECHFLNKAALNSVVGHLPAATQHFKLNEKRKPKSAALRSELHQKCLDATNNLKKSTAPTVPVRSRGMPRKMTDTTPLKGIPSRVPLPGFRSPALSSSPLTNRSSLNNRIRKDGGIKLLDINEQPLGYAQAKKRKRQQELEEQQKKAEEAKAAAAQPPPPVTPTTEVSTTPEYAQGLAPAVSQPPATPAVVTAVVTPAVTPTTTDTKPAVPYTPTISTATVPVAVVATPVPAPTSVSTVPTTQNVITPVESIPVTVQTVRPPPTVTQIRIGAPSIPVQQANAGTTIAAAPRRGLSLTREQMLEAQEMFRTANKVTRPEKALILGFMAGSRDNPCPKLGNIVTVMLSENIEEVIQPDGSSALMTVETHFQMNYTNGEWKRIKKNRKIVEEGANVVVAH